MYLMHFYKLQFVFTFMYSLNGAKLAARKSEQGWKVKGRQLAHWNVWMSDIWMSECLTSECLNVSHTGMSDKVNEERHLQYYAWRRVTLSLALGKQIFVLGRERGNVVDEQRGRTGRRSSRIRRTSRDGWRRAFSSRQQRKREQSQSAGDDNLHREVNRSAKILAFRLDQNAINPKQ